METTEPVPLTTVGGGSASRPTDEPVVLLSLKDTAVILGIHRSTAYDLARRGAFPVPVLRVGKLLKINRSHLDDYLAGKLPQAG